jgi:hypothetical protein
MEKYELVKLGVMQTRPEMLDALLLLGAPKTDEPFEKRLVTAGQALFLWLTDVIRIRKPVGDTSRRLLLNHFKAEIQEFGNRLSWALDNGNEVPALPGVLLTVADNTLAGLTNTTGWLDLRTGDVVKDLPKPPLEVVSYNLTGLFIEMDRLYRKRGEVNARRPARTPG